MRMMIIDDDDFYEVSNDNDDERMRIINIPGMILPWDKSTLAPEFSHVEAIVVHFSEHRDDVPGTERKLNLW